MSSTATTQTQQQTSVAASQAMASDAAADDRKLTFEVLTSKNDKADGLRLIIDGVAQQRQEASRALIFHPIYFSVLVAVISMIHMSVKSIRSDYSAMMVTYSGVLITYLVAVRYVTSCFIRVAEETDWAAWLAGSDGADDVMLGARFGSVVIASIVLRLPSSKKPRGSKAAVASGSSAKTVVIRAWTTKLRYRRRGLGGDMLREAVKLARKALGPDSAIEFAEDHANSTLLPLPDTFNAVFASRDRRAREELQEAVRELDAADQAQQ